MISERNDYDYYEIKLRCCYAEGNFSTVPFLSSGNYYVISLIEMMSLDSAAFSEQQVSGSLIRAVSLAIPKSGSYDIFIWRASRLHKATT